MQSSSSKLSDAEELLLAGHLESAVDLVDGLLREEPRNCEAAHVRALAEIARGDLQRGVSLLLSALANCAEPAWIRDLGVACLAAGTPARAIEPLESALRVHPDEHDIRLLLARLLLMEGNARRAIELLDGAAPSIEAYDLSARAATALLHFDWATDLRRMALDISPEDVELQCALSNALWMTGEMEECLAIARSALAQSDSELTHSAWLAAIDHTTNCEQESKRAWENWAASTRMSGVPSEFTVSRDPDRRLRVGYLIDDVHKGPNSYSIPALIESHDFRQFEVFLYLASPNAGEPVTAYPSQASFRDCRSMNSQEIAKQVHADAMDLLVNVSWEFRGRHLAVFDYRPAPLQIELPHYPATTGHPGTDFILTDPWICPPGSEGMYSENVIRLDQGYLPWTPPVAPDLTEAPIAANGSCTFGIFQRPAKFNETFWDAVSEILRLTPGSKLLVHFNSADLEIPASSTRRHLSWVLTSRGISRDRVTFIGQRDRFRHLEAVAQCDLALDTFPYNGATTTGDCLWMGVPVITLAGRTHAGRVGFSMLSRAGLSGFVVHDLHDYVATAVRLAQSPSDISEFRLRLRRMVKESTLTDAQAVMSDIQHGYRQVWRSFCEARLEPNERKQ